jgi:hypothetical protein
MLTGTIWITLGILTLMTTWHFWKNRETFKSSFAMYKTFLAKKENLEEIQKKHAK